jgi:MFS transporter, DHA3 family, macrolide efflux protein
MAVRMTDSEKTSTNWKARFFTIWIPQQVSILGSALGRFAMIWWLTETTGSATVLATATMVATIPDVLLGPIAGAYVDRHNRQRIMIAADALVALASAVLAVLFWTNSLQIWHVYAIMLIRSLGSQFHWPAMHASTSLMVPEGQLSRIAGINSATQGALRIIAPPLGAMLLSLLRLHGVMIIDVLTAAIAIAPLFLVTIPQPSQFTDSSRERTSLSSDLREGLKYVAGWPGLMGVLGMALTINLVLNPAASLLPILVRNVFGGGATELGWVNSAFGLGVLAGGLVLGAWGGFRRRMATSLLGLVGLGAGCLIIGLAQPPLFWLLITGLLIMGMMNSITNGPLMAILQAKVEPEMQGRVFTLVGAGAAAISPLGLAMAGPLADTFGVQVWYVLGGAICVLLGIGAAFVPSIINMEDHVLQPSDSAAD